MDSKSAPTVITNHTSLIVLLVAGLIFLVSGCNRSEDTPITHPESSEVSAPAAAPSAGTVTCPDGSQGIVLSGNCKGDWSFNAAQSSCDFKWGPLVECPKGTVSQSHPSACYGVTSKKYSGQGELSSSQCESQFGPQLEPFSYELVCCSAP